MCDWLIDLVDEWLVRLGDGGKYKNTLEGGHQCVFQQLLKEKGNMLFWLYSFKFINRFRSMFPVFIFENIDINGHIHTA
jgi:hypothetical protein